MKWFSFFVVWHANVKKQIVERVELFTRSHLLKTVKLRNERENAS